MMSRRNSMIVMMSVVAVSSGLYGIYELSPPVAFVGGSAQYMVHTYEEMVKLYPIIVVGEITNVGTKHFTEKSEEEDYEGNIIDVQTRKVPKAELTIKISDVLKDDVGLGYDTVVIYDKANGIGTNFDGWKTEYGYDNVIKHTVGDKGIFFISDDRGLTIDGYSSYYPIIDGKTTVTTELDKKTHPIYLENGMNGKPPIDLELAKRLAKADQ